MAEAGHGARWRGGPHDRSAARAPSCEGARPKPVRLHRRATPRGPAAWPRRAVLGAGALAGGLARPGAAGARPQPSGGLARLFGMEETPEQLQARAQRVRQEQEAEAEAEAASQQYTARGIKFRDMAVGDGAALGGGAKRVAVSYTVYKLAKRSYGGLAGDPVYMYSLGYGNEFQVCAMGCVPGAVCRGVRAGV